MINTNSNSQDKPQAVLIHIGANDIETLPAQDLFNEVEGLINNFKRVLPNSKLILSEITPRIDCFDRKVMQKNEMIDALIPTDEK